MILNIETSGPVCSVALCHEGEVMVSKREDSPMNHAVSLAPFVDECYTKLRQHQRELDAVAVSIGPGSYTGLRIGLSMAKGLCVGSKVPLITIDTLKILAVKAMFASGSFPAEDTLFIPMTDARRMEVYTAVYDMALNEIEKPHPLVLDEYSFSKYLNSGRPCVFIGSGVEKARSLLSSPNAKWMEGMFPLATDMMALSELAFRKQEFADVAYSQPKYLKEFGQK